MNSPHHQHRCSTVLQLIDDCLAEYERGSGARVNRPSERHPKEARSCSVR